MHSYAAGLGIKIDALPPFASIAALELYSWNSSYYLRFVYNGVVVLVAIQHATCCMQKLSPFLLSLSCFSKYALDPAMSTTSLPSLTTVALISS